MAFSLTKSASRSAVRSSAPARKVQNVRCQAMPDFKAPIRSAMISAATVAVALSMTLGAGASEELGAAAQRTASELGSKVQNSASQLKGQANQAGNKISNTVQNAQGSNPLQAVKNKVGNPLSDVKLPQLPQVPNVGNPLAGAGAKVQQVTDKLGNPLQAGSDIVQSTADNIVKDTPFAGSKVSKSVPIEDAANGPDPTGRIKYT